METKEIKNVEKIDEAYHLPWWLYDLRGFFILTFSYRDTLWHQIDFFNKNIHDEHLEVAVGSGSLLKIILQWRWLRGIETGKIYAFDYATSMIKGAKRNFRKYPNVVVFRADCANLDYPDNTFGSANIANAFHTFPEVQPCIKEVYRVLKPGAYMAVNIVLYPPQNGGLGARIADKIAKWGMKKGILHKPYHEQEVLDILKTAGFRIEKTYTKGYALNIKAQK